MYQKYRRRLAKEAFFATWEAKNVNALSEEMKDYIYKKYLLKCEVFNRDNFQCQNVNCSHQSKKLTLHHIKWRKNNGEDKARNGITLCRSCHNGYHKARIAITFANAGYLPAHIRGHTFKLTKPDKIDWKKIRSDMKKLRANIKFEIGDRAAGYWFKMTWEQIAILMRWLYIPFEEDDD